MENLRNIQGVFLWGVHVSIVKGWREFSIKKAAFFFKQTNVLYKTDITQKTTLLQYFLLSYAWLLLVTKLLSSGVLMRLIFAGIVGIYQYIVKFSISCYGMQKWPFCVHLLSFTAVFFLLIESEYLHDIKM